MNRAEQLLLDRFDLLQDIEEAEEARENTWDWERNVEKINEMYADLDAVEKAIDRHVEDLRNE